MFFADTLRDCAVDAERLCDVPLSSKKNIDYARQYINIRKIYTYTSYLRLDERVFRTRAKNTITRSTRVAIESLGFKFSLAFNGIIDTKQTLILLVYVANDYLIIKLIHVPRRGIFSLRSVMPVGDDFFTLFLTESFHDSRRLLGLGRGTDVGFGRGCSPLVHFALRRR